MMKRLIAALLSLSLATSTLAMDLPDLGDVAASTLSPLEERQLGERVMQDIRWRDPSYLDDAEIEQYVQALGMRLVRASDSPDGQFEFFVIRDPSINAFAMPGGYIGLNSGLITTAESESELASVVGHEVAHVTQRHIAQLFGKQGEASMIMLASMLVAVLASRSSSQLSEAAVFAGQAGAIQSQLSYTRAFEREADRIGLQALEGAGFDVRGMPSFFERLQRSTRVYENNAPDYLRTHPLTQERIADMSTRVGQMQYRQVADSLDFRLVRAKLRAADGLATDAIALFQAELAKAPDNAISRYGLARALLRAGKTTEAAQQLQQIRDAGQLESPFVEVLAAEIALAQRDPLRAITSLQEARSRYPEARALEYLLIEAYLQARDAQQAASLARTATVRDQSDARMWILLARAESLQGRKTAHHRAQAEVYVLQGSRPAAIEQLELARRAGDGDFFEMSAVDARMRQLRQEDLAERQREKR